MLKKLVEQCRPSKKTKPMVLLGADPGLVASRVENKNRGRIKKNEASSSNMERAGEGERERDVAVERNALLFSSLWREEWGEEKGETKRKEQWRQKQFVVVISFGTGLARQIKQQPCGKSDLEMPQKSLRVTKSDPKKIVETPPSSDNPFRTHYAKQAGRTQAISLGRLGLAAPLLLRLQVLVEEVQGCLVGLDAAHNGEHPLPRLVMWGLD